jgi:hypothetical protein
MTQKRINIIAKGKEGEREVARALNAVLSAVLCKHAWPPEIIRACENSIQRNQNQSAVGGSDLSNVFGIAVEVKRQEAISLNTWWTQCVAGANRNKEFPVLVYRANHQPWRVVMYASLALPILNEGGTSSLSCRVTLEWEDFLKWFEKWVERKLMNGEYPRV